MPDQSTAPSLAGAITVGRFQLPYIIEGTGQPAIVIGSCRYYQRVFSGRLRTHLRLVFMDHRGFAPSPGPADVSEFELERIVDDVEALRCELGLGPVVVIGHSGHAYMALEYGKKYPESTSHVVLIGVAPDLSQSSAALAERNYQALADADRLTAERENMLAVPDGELAKLPPDQAFVRGYIRNAARGLVRSAIRLHRTVAGRHGQYGDLRIPVGQGVRGNRRHQAARRLGLSRVSRPWPLRLHRGAAVDLGARQRKFQEPDRARVREKRPYPAARGAGVVRRTTVGVDQGNSSGHRRRLTRRKAGEGT